MRFFFFFVEADIGHPDIDVERAFFHPYLAVEGLDFRFFPVVVFHLLKR